MADKLVIVESPAKAKTIGKFLGRGYKVEASNGHVRDLPKSQIGVDIENGFIPKYITIRGRGEILDKIRREAKGASRVYLATDPDREGEAISWHLAHVLGIDPSEPCRIEFHEITSKAIKEAVKAPRPIDINLVNAQQARRVLDRLLGYKISPLLWAKLKRGLSAGRVQSVATRMICDRESEIDAFVPEEYWSVTAALDSPVGSKKSKFEAKLSAIDGTKAIITSAGQAEAAEQKILAESFAVRAIKFGEKRKKPTAPFTTSNLQQEAQRKLGFTTQKTMQVAQQLYEGVDIKGEGTVGMISYIRTDSTRVSEEALTAVREYITARYGPSYLPEEPNQYKGRKKAQDAHEAIRPTDMNRHPDKVKDSVTREQFRLYKLVYERFVASQMTDAVYDTMSVTLAGDKPGPELHFGGMKKKFAGFTIVYEEGRDDEPEEREVTFPDLKEGQTLKIAEVRKEQHFTQPPPRYTEASLVRALEDKGIGRPSTYAPTITTVVARGYVARENKRLIPTELGLIVTRLMTEYFTDIVDITFTADMEEELDRIEEEDVDWHGIIREFYGPFSKMLANAEESIEKVEVNDVESDVVCEKCGANMVYKVGRYGKFLACPNFPECRNTKAILVEIEVPCPKCGAKLYERMSRKGRKFFGCEKYPECDFVSWDMPVADLCPICGSHMVYKRGKKGHANHVCVNETCRHRVEVADEGETEDGDELEKSGDTKPGDEFEEAGIEGA